MTVKKNGFPISGTSAYPAKVKVGDEVELECYSKLGSIPNTEIEWWKTSSVGDIWEQIQQNNVKFIKYNPGAFGSNGVETSGQIRELDAECSREQTTTLRYNVSKADQVRGIVAFKCYVQVTPPVSGSSPNVQLDPVIVNSTSFYMEIGMLNILLFSSHLYIAPDNLFSQPKLLIGFLSLHRNRYCVAKGLLMSAHNICFHICLISPRQHMFCGEKKENKLTDTHSYLEICLNIPF